MVNKMVKKLIFGVGVNDADYFVNPRVGKKRVMCQFYQCWHNMIRRCYSAYCQARQPAYIGCSVCEEWLTFSNFKAWMEKQDWEGKELDKDILFKGNKIYSPETCVFVCPSTNLFTITCTASRGEWPLGVDLYKATGKFKSQCSNNFTKKKEHLGYFSTPDEAHAAWKKRKHELACQLADLQTDQRVADALRSRSQ